MKNTARKDAALDLAYVADAARVMRLLSKPSKLVILLILADGPKPREELRRLSGHGEANFRSKLTQLMNAGLVEKGSAFWRNCYRLSRRIRVTEEAMQIDASGLPITIGRYVQEAE